MHGKYDRPGSNFRLYAILGWLLVVPGLGWGQESRLYNVEQANIQRRATGVLALMGYAQTPDVTSGALSIHNAATGNPSFSNTSLGGGFTVSNSVPLYLEGTVGYSRYDPRFVSTEGEDARVIPTRWNSLVATAGVGWDFHLTNELIFRPIVDGSYGRVESDVSLASQVITNRTDVNLNFLTHGYLNASGVGSSLMLAYYHDLATHEVDVELRYTDILMRSVNYSTTAGQGSSRNDNLSLWARMRAPTGLYAFDRPLRYVLELAHTTYFGEEADVLGVNHLTSLGAGLELDTSKSHPLWISRVRGVLRYVYGQNVRGVSLGFAITMP